MLAISGAHVSYFLLGISFLLEKQKIAKRKIKIILIIFLLFFMALVGFTPSVTRACVMTILQILSSLCFRKADTFTNLAIASLFIMINNPYAVFDIGFQLSFGGTIGILVFQRTLDQWLTNKISQYFTKKNFFKEKQCCKSTKIKVYVKKGLSKLKEYCKETILVTLSANLVIFPIMLYHFNSISIIFFVSNLLASPFLTLNILLSLFIICFSFLCFPLAKIFSYVVMITVSMLIKIAHLTANMPFANLLVATPKIPILLFYYFVLLFFLKKKQLTKVTQRKIFIIIICLILFFLFSSFLFSVIPSKELKIFFVDVGQGDCTLIQTPCHQTILIDGGGSEFGSTNVGEQTLLPYLLDKGITTIDYMLFSHFDTDHCQRFSLCNAKNKGKANIYHKARKKLTKLSRIFKNCTRKENFSETSNGRRQHENRRKCYFTNIISYKELYERKCIKQ